MMMSKDLKIGFLVLGYEDRNIYIYWGIDWIRVQDYHTKRTLPWAMGAFPKLHPLHFNHLMMTIHYPRPFSFAS